MGAPGCQGRGGAGRGGTGRGGALWRYRRGPSAQRARLHAALGVGEELEHDHHQGVVLGRLLGGRAPHDGLEPVRQHVPRPASRPPPLARALAALAGALTALGRRLARVRLLLAGAVAGPTLGDELEPAQRKQLLVGVHEQRLHDLAASVGPLLEDSFLCLGPRDGLLGVLAHQDCRAARMGWCARARGQRMGLRGERGWGPLSKCTHRIGTARWRASLSLRETAGMQRQRETARTARAQSRCRRRRPWPCASSVASRVGRASAASSPSFCSHCEPGLGRRRFAGAQVWRGVQKTGQ